MDASPSPNTPIIAARIVHADMSMTKPIRTDRNQQLMANQPDPTQQGVWPDQGRQLPDIPKVVTWATVLLILSAIPWLLVFADHIFAAPAVVPGTDFLASSYGAMLLNIGYLMLAVSVLNGHKWTRITITVGTVLVNFFMLTSMASLGRYLGQVGESEVGTVSFMLVLFAWTAVLSSIGLALLYTPASNTYIARSEAYKTYIDQQNAGRSSQLWLARLERR